MKVKITATAIVETELSLEQLQEDCAYEAFEYLSDRLGDSHDDDNKITVEELPS